MTDTEPSSRRGHIFNLGFRRGANDRDAASLPYTSHTPWPTSIPAASSECLTDDEREHWTTGYRMGYVIGASDRDIQRHDHVA